MINFSYTVISFCSDEMDSTHGRQPSGSCDGSEDADK
jgi:hypothetical protein